MRRDLAGGHALGVQRQHDLVDIAEPPLTFLDDLRLERARTIAGNDDLDLAEALCKEVAAHSSCWDKTGPPSREGTQATTTHERWLQVHDLLDSGVGLLECARRLGLVLNTVKRYARINEPERLIRAPKYRPTLVDPYREHLRHRRESAPAVPVQRLFEEIKQLGYTGSLNLLHRYITQGRVASDRPAISPRRLARYLLTRPDRLTDHQRERLDTAVAACPEMTTLAGLVGDVAALLTPSTGNDERLTGWIDQARAEDLPHLHAFTRGLELDCHTVDVALTQLFHNGRTEELNATTKMIKRQMYGRAAFTLLPHRILPN